MSFWDWMIVIIPTLFVLGMGMYSRRYLRDVTTFLSAGRVCGRYVISVGDIASGLSILGLLSYVEIHYKTGFATTFWTSLLLPVGVVLGLFGYVTYRFRETKSQSIGQFLEMRYSRNFRIFASALRSISEMLANMIMPALAARFFIYFLDLPHYFTLWGIEISTFHLVMIICLFMAISIICMGGAMSIIITDTIQGFICYPMLCFMVIYIMVKFPWNAEMMPVMVDRVPGESFINPTDIAKLRDFNLFSLLLLPFVTQLLQRASWIGAGSSSTAARSPHEQKMASLLGTWRQALGQIFYVLIAVALLTLLNHQNHSEQAHEVRLELTRKISHEIVTDKTMRENVIAGVQQMPVQKHIIGQDTPLSDKSNIDTRYLDTVKKQLTAENADIGTPIYQKFRTLYYQLMLPVTLRNMLPSGMMGMFCLLMILLMISTDDTRIFSATVTVSQDVILPLRKKKLTPREHMWMVRLVAIGIGIFFFLGSSFMAQLDYIALFVALMCTMWLGGCGPVLILGLYSRFGTTAGAWTSLLTGMFMALGGMAIQRNWAGVVYPWLRDNNLLEGVTNVLTALSRPMMPYIDWSNVVQDKCPINSYELYFFTMMLTLVLYCVVSFLTCKEPYNLDRMLHRGKYALDGERNIKSDWSFRNVFNKLIGITPEYTTGDKFIAWSYFVYSFIYRFGLTFLLVIIWNAITPWPIEYWSWYFLITILIVPGFMAAVTAVWFGICSPIDLVQMFRDLQTRTINELDDGRVEGNMSLADKAQLEAIDRQETDNKTAEENK
ncbi:MAG: sodium:panthothenate symporter [Lentisphaerae bacterium]|nr:sodium:panthothenate symporter [Lentisphaerota bacterium]